MEKTSKRQTGDDDTPAWDESAVESLIRELWALRKALLERQDRLEPLLRTLDAGHRPSAINLVHYLALRQIDLRQLQDRLARIGVTSLGRAESHVLANVDKALGILHRLAGRPWMPLSGEEPAGFSGGPARLAQHAQSLFGPPPARRSVRIMVTLPSEAAHDRALVERLVDGGLDVARINCAHDSAAEWAAMAAAVREAAARAGRPVRVLMDVAGPKLRTGPIAGGPAVLRVRPRRDAFGRTTAPARFMLCAAGSTATGPGDEAAARADAAWLDSLQIGDRIDLTDARDARRRLLVVDRQPGRVQVETERGLYLTNGLALRRQRKGPGPREAVLSGIAEAPGELRLARGDLIDLVAKGLGQDAAPASPGQLARRASVACTLPEVLARVRAGERIWFDDGHIGGTVRSASARKLEIEITEARSGGARLAADKGINLPDTRLDLPALTPKDLEDLKSVAQHADIVGLSFAQSAADVRALRQRLAELGAAHLGLIVKIETRRAFEHLPAILLAAMAGPAAGVMIARGDLAVECGWERLAEVQEEILWACEAAHLPVVWATQVLETLAKTGQPSRAEITDAAMGGRAECVMLNKGPHVVEAMRTLDDILRRMQSHQAKKRPLLRALKAWKLEGGAGSSFSRIAGDRA
ncbi:MAG: pyruvate kinase [Burkholderiaceae bacterium]|nr:pyruvate kinase [Burkholderiaceae bacterium]